MEELDLVDMWFQHDGATFHTTRETMNQLGDEFGEQLISRFGAVNWPPRSCDLTPLDYFLWCLLNASLMRFRPKCVKKYAIIGSSEWTTTSVAAGNIYMK